MKMKNNSLQIKDLTKTELAKLAEIKRNGDFALSFYLGLKPEVNFRSEINSVLSGEAENIKKNKEYSVSDKKKIFAMIERIKKEIGFLRLPSEARTLVFFLREKSEILIFRIPVRLPSKIVIEADHYIYPLEKIIEEFPRYLVVGVDRDKAEFSAIFLGKIEGEQDVLVSDVPKKVRTSSSDDWKGRREKRIERHIEDHLNKHFKAVASKIREYFDANGFDHLIIGGHGETNAKFREFLDKKSIEKLIGFFSLSHRDHNYIKEKSMEIIKNHEKDMEEKIAGDLLNNIGGKKWDSVVGTDSVLENLYLHKIKMIVIGANYKQSGFICGQCHYIAIDSGICPLCYGRISKAADVADEIIEEAFKKKIKIKQLFHSHKDFDRFGIGAFLRDY